MSKTGLQQFCLLPRRAARYPCARRSRAIVAVLETGPARAGRRVRIRPSARRKAGPTDPANRIRTGTSPGFNRRCRPIRGARDAPQVPCFALPAVPRRIECRHLHDSGSETAMPMVVCEEGRCAGLTIGNTGLEARLETEAWGRPEPSARAPSVLEAVSLRTIRSHARGHLAPGPQVAF